MTFTLSITRTAQKSLASIARRDRERIYQRLDQLALDPYATANVKKLQGEENFRLRIGDYRILYLIEDAKLVIVVVDVGHRREVYR
jgi:mRNA interferase RelE/StbE